MGKLSKEENELWLLDDHLIWLEDIHKFYTDPDERPDLWQAVFKCYWHFNDKIEEIETKLGHWD
jgi:hypothetical protein